MTTEPTANGCTCSPCASCRMRLSQCCPQCPFCQSLPEHRQRVELNAWLAVDFNVQAVTGALDALLWTGSCNGTAVHDDCRGEDCDSGLDDLGYTSDDFAPGAAYEVTEDLADFMTRCLAQRPECFADVRYQADPGAVGHDFILTSQGQGVGFWDRGLGELGTWLTEQAETHGGLNACLGDDNMIYVHG